MSELALLSRNVRAVKHFARGLSDTSHPLLVHVIPIRRCNIDCGYCNEYDKISQPVPTDTMLARIDDLARLGTSVTSFSGGEPLLHPDLDRLIGRIRSHGMMAGLITNGYLLSPKRIEALNRAGLDYLQISIDNVEPDEVSKKSLKVLDQKLSSLATAAEFDVTVNAVVGSGVRNPADALTIAKRARSLGFSTTAGIIHDGSGRLVALDEEQRTVLEQVVSLGKSWLDFANYNRFQKNLAAGQPNDWQCHAGARYLYICEDGLVHWCSQQRGHPGIPLSEYSLDDLRTEYHRVKSCAPMCTVGCVHRVAQVDDLREDPQGTLAQWFAAPVRGQPPRLPLPVKILKWAFVTSPGRGLFRKAAAGMSGGPRRS